MTQHTITHQPTILRIIREHGMDGHVKPQNPKDPGCVCLFPATPDGTFCLIENRSGTYKLILLKQANLKEAMSFMESYVATHVEHPGKPRVSIVKIPSDPSNN